MATCMQSWHDERGSALGPWQPIDEIKVRANELSARGPAR
jgi:hypothetical protein